MVKILKIVTAIFIDPINVLFILLVLSIAAYFFKKKILLSKLTYLGIGLFLITVTPFIPNLLIGHLEKQYKSLDISTLDTVDRPIDILVLGSGHTADPKVPSLGQLSKTALQRLTEGIRIMNKLPGSRLIVSGYGKWSVKSQGEVMFEAAHSLGVPKDRIVVQSAPSTTEEEAASYFQRNGTGHSLIVVTSASHMPRAVYLFKKAQLSPIPAPTAYEILKEPGEPFLGLFISAKNFRKVEMALHEYLGMLWARW